ncbi:MAG TPA: crosslink repair DNA glycosylase YcaQ family protein, partial [Chloroflexota bacterium]|nr:crosslink repair DNA glycosylase YcaQ family protein [Chloroflexota bacterium]
MNPPSESPASFTWDQVSGFRLARQGLLCPSGHDPVSAASRTAGVHAQVMSCAELAISLRTESVRRSAVAECLWERHTLLKMWAMRGTLHLLPAGEIGLWSSALSTHRHFMAEAWMAYLGLESSDVAAMIEAVRVALDGRTLTREELAAEMAAAAGNELARQHLRSGWGSLLKPASYRGYLCFGPNRGRNVTFTSPAALIGPWQPWEDDQAIKEAARRYLRTYGPATTR